MIGIYLSGTGNTKHCVEKLVNLIDDKSKCVPLEFPQIIDLLKKEDVIFLGYPTQFSNSPFIVRNFIKKNSSLWKDKKAIPENKCTMCYRCISLCPQKAITLLGDKVIEQSRFEKYV